MKSFLTRLGSGILLVAIILVTGAYGSWPLWIAVTLAGFVGLHEFYRAVDIQKNDLLWWIGMIGTGMWAFIEWIVCGGDPAWKENLWLTLVAAPLCCIMAAICDFPILKYNTRKIMAAYFRHLLCAGDAEFYLSDPDAGRWISTGLADLLKCMGLRHLRILYRCTDRKA